MSDAVTQSAAPNAIERFLAALQEIGGIDLATAKRVLAHYRKIRVVVIDHRAGHVTVKHGAFLDADVIRKAAAL